VVADHRAQPERPASPPNPRAEIPLRGKTRCQRCRRVAGAPAVAAWFDRLTTRGWSAMCWARAALSLPCA